MAGKKRGPEAQPQVPKEKEFPDFRSIEDLKDRQKGKIIYDRLLRHAVRLTGGNVEDALDLVQSGIEKALLQQKKAEEGLIAQEEGFREGTSLMSWLYRTTQNEHNDKMRHLQVRKKFGELLNLSDKELGIALRDEIGVPAVQQRELEWKQLAEMIRREIDNLPGDYSRPLMLRVEEERTYEEIAEIEKIPLGTVMSRLARARSSLRKKLGYPSK